MGKGSMEENRAVIVNHPSPGNRIKYLERSLLDISEKDFPNNKSLERLFGEIKYESDSLHTVGWN